MNQQEKTDNRYQEALQRLYDRPVPPAAWTGSGNLPWNDPEFSERMLREHLDESHSAASRRTPERARQLDWLWRELALAAGSRVLDITCGPGLYAVPLAQRGCHVVGYDFSPASIRHARDRAGAAGVADRCRFVQTDVRDVDFAGQDADAALFLYGQSTVFRRAETQALFTAIAGGLRPGGRLILEVLNPARIDKKNSSWWFTDNTGLWGDAPFLHLGERFWDEAEQLVLERFHTLHLGTGQMDTIHLCDQAYQPEAFSAMLGAAGFAAPRLFPGWGDLDLYDREEWLVYVAQRAVE